VRAPFFCGNLLHHLDFEVALCQELLQAGILLLQLPQPLNLVGVDAAETLTPGVNRLFADAVLLGDLATGSRSASRRMPTICSSENLPFLMAPPPSSPGATLSSFSWSEKCRAGHSMNI